MLPFGIASLVFSVVAIFIPVFGIMISGLSGFLAWLSTGKGTPFGAAAVIINFINILLLSPAYILVAGLEASQRNHDQGKLFTIWAIVLFVQIAAVVVFICNVLIDYSLKHRANRKSRNDILRFNKQDPPQHFVKPEVQQSMPIEPLSYQTEEGPGKSSQDISKFTKVLIHKIHGGRKKDSKFWNDQIDLTKKNDDKFSIPIPENSARLRRSLQISIYPFATLLIVLVVLIFARPELFPFFDYHKIYSTISELFPNKTNTPVISKSSPKPAEALPRPVTTPRPYTKNAAPVTPKQERPLITLSNAQSDKHGGTQTNMLRGLQPISLSGKVFSWEDQDGKRYFSNTNFPLDNETLQVQTEISNYHKVTKISVINNQIYIPVTLWNNGRSATLNMVLDTGCSHTTVPYKYLNHISAEYGQKVTSRLADGKTTVGRKAFLDMIQVGSRKEKNFTVTGAKNAGAVNSGLLGLDFLKKHTFKIDFENQFLVWM
jgi:hypothetical protein